VFLAELCKYNAIILWTTFGSLRKTSSNNVTLVFCSIMNGTADFKLDYSLIDHHGSAWGSNSCISSFNYVSGSVGRSDLFET